MLDVVKDMMNDVKKELLKEYMDREQEYGKLLDILDDKTLEEVRSRAHHNSQMPNHNLSQMSKTNQSMLINQPQNNISNSVMSN